MGFTSTRCYLLLQAITVCSLKKNKRTKLEKMTKNLVSGSILACLAEIWGPQFYLWILPVLDVRH